MSKPAERFETSILRDDELEGLQKLLTEHPRLVGAKGNGQPLPSSLSELLLHVVEGMRQGKTFVVVPEDETLTTQRAARFLGVSRPFLIGLLDTGRIPSFKVGSHRRVRFADLRTYAKNRDEARRRALDDLFDSIDEAGLYV